MRRLPLLLLLLASACARPVPAPAPTPAPPDRTAEYTATCTDIWREQLSRAIDASGSAACLDKARAGWTKDQVVDWVQASDEYVALHTFHPLPRLVARGQFFGLETGERWTAIESSDFNLYARFLAGEDIEPVLSQRAALGFNLLRVFTAYSVGGIGRLVPSEHPDYDTRLSPFLRALAKHGLYAELVAFTGPYTGVLDGEEAQATHWARLVAVAAAETNVLLEGINEYDNPPNAGTPIATFAEPPVLASHGSADADAMPLQPFWGYVTYHPGFGADWPRKAAHNGMSDVADLAQRPVLVNETTRYPDNDSSPQHAYDAARGAALLVAGACFHSVSGKASQPWTGAELDAAKAWAAGARSMPLACQAGPYVHRADLETAGISRVYQRGSDPACLAVIRE